MTDNNTTGERILQTLPVLIAFAFHALAFERWLLIGVATIGLGLAILRQAAFVPTSRHWYFAIAAGLVAGLVFPPTGVPVGPLPPGMSGNAAGIAIAVAVLAVLCRRTTVALAAAWSVLVLSGKHVINPQLNATLLLFCLASLIAAASASRLLRLRWRSLFILTGFGVLTAISTAGISLAIEQADRALVNTVGNLINQNPTSSITGLSNNITLGKKSEITLSKRPLLELSEMPGVLRTKVMDDFNGVRWTTSPTLNATVDSYRRLLERPRNRRDLQIIFLDDINNSLPSPAGTYGVVDATKRIAGGWILRGEPNGVSVTMMGDRDEKLPSEPEPDETLTAVPNDLAEGLGPIAKELTDSLPTNLGKAKAIATFFQRNFEYSLSTDLRGKKHPLVTLVEQRRPAYCVYFASATAAMLRTQDVPTRVVSGFVPNEVNALTGRVTIRARDAHAWVEVWSPDEKRYFPFDPTPVASRRQANGFAEPESFASSMIQAIRSTARRFWLIARQNPARLLWMVLSSPFTWLAIVVLLVVLVRKWRRPRRVSATQLPDTVDPAVREVYDRYLTTLRQAGVEPHPWESDQELIDRVADSGEASLAKAAGAFIAKYQATRFGRDQLDSELARMADLRPAGEIPN